MGDLGEGAGRGGARPALDGTVLAHQLREFRLQRVVLAHQLVVLGVGNLRRVLVVITLVVIRDLARQLLEPGSGFGFGHAKHSARKSAADVHARLSASALYGIPSSGGRAWVKPWTAPP